MYCIEKSSIIIGIMGLWMAMVGAEEDREHTGKSSTHRHTHIHMRITGTNMHTYTCTHVVVVSAEDPI